MSDYITITGTLQDPIQSDTTIDHVIMKITSNQFSLLNPIPTTKTITIDSNGEYNFNLLKGVSYTVSIISKPKSGSQTKSQSVNFSIEVPITADDSETYDITHFMVTVFTPLLQSNEIVYTKFIQDSSPYYLILDNQSILVQDVTYDRQKTLNLLFVKGGLLSNNSFEYDLVNEEYTFLPIISTGTSNITTDYNNDTPFNIYATSSDYSIEADTRSLELDITLSGADITDTILRQQLLPNSIKNNKQYRLRFSYKLVSGTTTGSIEVKIKNTNGDLVNFDNLTIDNDNNGWVLYDSSVVSIDDEYLVRSSQNIYLDIEMGSLGSSILLRLDEFVLDEKYENNE